MSHQGRGVGVLGWQFCTPFPLRSGLRDYGIIYYV
jgi:hypothetical protein